MSATLTPTASPKLPHVAEGTYPWLADLGDGTYQNPVLWADYSDPDVVRHGDDFYLTASSFNCTPGLPIMHSRDLVNWSLINHALKNIPGERYRQVQHGCGVWAPAIRFHADKFWIFFPTPDEGIYVTTATDPAGQWSEPHLLQAGRGLIDPCPLWDDDGQAYLVHAYAGSRAGIKHRLRVCPMAPDGSRLLGEGQIVFHEPERHPTLEGPKFFKRDGWYYILAPAGGVATGWQVVLRSRNVFGPYEDRIVLEQGDTPINGPHQGALVDTATNEWWFLHFQDVGALGRILHLQPVTWLDGWPRMGQLTGHTGIPVLRQRKPISAGKIAPHSPVTSDEFTTSRLGLQWQWHANHEAHWHSLSRRDGWLSLLAQPRVNTALADQPNLLLQKLPARSFTVETLLDLANVESGTEAGLALVGRASAALALRREANGYQIIFRDAAGTTPLGKVKEGNVRLRVAVRSDETCEFAWASAGEPFQTCPHNFKLQPGVWIGAKIGLYAVTDDARPEQYAAFDYFRFARPTSVLA
jgi:beta-xylosidase